MADSFLSRQFLPALQSFGTVLAARPLLLLTALVTWFYISFSWHLPWLWIVVFVLPVAVLNYVLMYAGRSLISQRLADPNLRLYPELGIAALLVVVLFFTDALVETIWIALLPPLLVVWLVLLSYQRKAGVFYTVFSGLMLFGMVVFSYRLLYLEERLLILVHQYFRLQELRELVLERSLRWDTQDQDRFLRRGDETYLRVRVPEKLEFHEAGRAGAIYGLPLAGLPLCYLSSSTQDPFAPPALALFLNQAEMSDQALRSAARLALGHRVNAGEIGELLFRGERELPEDVLGIDLKGVVYEFRDLVYEKQIRMELYRTPAYPAGRRYTIILQYEPVKGFFVHPLLLTAIEGLRLTGLAAPETK